MIKEGETVKEFSLSDDSGKTVSLSDFSGKKKVVYFYPKDDTPGCTKEACSFRDSYDAILGKGAVVLGVSKDSVDSHKKFKEKFNLPFHLLADENQEVIDQFGAWGEKTRFGKTSQGIIRSTFVLDEQNKVIKAFPNVKPEEHAAQILKYL